MVWDLSLLSVSASHVYMFFEGIDVIQNLRFGLSVAIVVFFNTSSSY